MLNRGQRFSNKLFLFKYTDSKQDFSQFAVIVSKKISKSAVERNRIRRKIFTAIRLKLGDLKKNLKCVVIPHKHITTVEYQDIENQINFFFKHI